MLKKIKVALICAVVAVGVSSCSSDDSSSSASGYEIVAKTSDNAVIHNIVVVEGGATESIADLGKNEWSKSFSGNKVVAVSVTGSTIKDGDKGFLTLEIIQDGKVIETSKSEGGVLVANVTK
ncbi:hypothetical protein [Myroides sp. DW712]|uniref:hypothetical protein n=1 Tax=Myroides sp. DW712 TaxID=3389800 RepID=UPI00397DF038